MGKIEKSSTARHDATLSPIIKSFIGRITKSSVRNITDTLATFPRLWPFPRGDLYHWIPALDRFDSILERYVKEYELDKGPQTKPFRNQISRSSDESTSDIEESKEIPEDADYHLLLSILRFTTLLLENCGNRSIYNSSAHLNHLLNTTDLHILTATLEVAVRLSVRYFSSRQRSATNSLVPPLHNLVAFNFDNVQKLASPFSTGASTSGHGFPLNFKGKETSDSTPSKAKKQPKVSGSDLSAFVAPKSSEALSQQNWTSVRLSYYAESKPSANPPPEPRSRSRNEGASPTASPTAHRSTNIPSRQSSSDDQPTSSANDHDDRKRSDQKSIEISSHDISRYSAEELVAMHVEKLPTDNKYDLVHKIRIAKAIASSHEDRELLLGIRLLAVANLAYICPESVFQQKVGQLDSDEPRRLQLAFQICDLLQPSVDGKETVSRRLQTIAIQTLEALTKQPKKSPEVNNALMSSQNHGVLFYMVRKMVTQLAEEDDGEVDYEAEDWRESLLALLVALPTSAHRQADHMVQAGMLQILVEVLQLRTNKADRFHARVLGFLDSFIYNVRDAFQTWASAKGLDAIADLTLYEVESAFDSVQQGQGIPATHKTSLTDYSIPFFKQQAIRMNFKFINHMMTHTGTNIDRLLRNLIDSPQLLSALRTVLRNAAVFGSNVWSSAATILSNFIHNEPTSYAVIAEAGLSNELLEAVTRTPIPDDPDATEAEVTTPAKPAQDRITPATGILPVPEAITAVPQAFGAICLTEAGMKLFKRSGALDAFFDIFDSPVHVKAMSANDRDVASELGHAFDELVRHHPSLRQMTLEAVRRMLENSLRSCSKKAREEGSGIKLWVFEEDEKLVVSGGRKALIDNSSPSSSDQTEDIEMGNSEDVSSDINRTVSYDEIQAITERKDNVDASEIISVASRFLAGLFSNSTICTNFIENGGMEYILDLATHPGLEHDFKKPAFPLPPSSSHQAYDVIRLLQIIMEMKPHLCLPPVLHRVNDTLQDLAPFSDSTDTGSFFSTFAYPASSGKDSADSALSHGTFYVKRLQAIYVLCSALMSALMQGKTYTHRSSSTIANQVNLTDVYVAMLDGLGKLQSACEWERTVLSRRAVEVLKLRKAIDSSVLAVEGGGSSSATERGSGNSQGAPDSIPQYESQHLGSVPESQRGPAYMKNIPLVDSLLDDVSQVITPLRLSFGKILLLRPRIETYPKQNAIKVADKLAQVAIAQLQYRKPAAQDNIEFRFKYYISVVRSLEDAMIEGSATDASGSPTQILTLVIQSFKNQGGFEVFRSILEFCAEWARTNVPPSDKDTADKSKDDPGFVHQLSLTAVLSIVTFYAQVVNSKSVNDATQTQALQSRSDRDRDRPDYFLPAQFLVELRTLIVKPVMDLWKSDFMNLKIRETARYIIDILRNVLEGETELGAFKRSDKLPKKREVTPRKWSPRHSEHLEALESDYGTELAREALFRCNDNFSNAREYCSVRKADPRLRPNPIPQEELSTPTRNRSPIPQPTAGSNQESEAQPSESAGETPITASVVMRDAQDSFSPPQLPVMTLAEDQLPSLLDFAGAPMPPPLERDASTPASRNSGIEAAKLPDVITVDDLDELRASLRTNMIDRILDVLNVHPDLTFELADLITATIAKSTDQTSLRQEVGTILVQSLISLKMDDDDRPEDWRAQGKKIASYAHLLALALQDRHFYNAALPDLKENFASLIDFIGIYPVSGDEEQVTWVGEVLLILEKLLSHDLQPHEIKYTSPPEDTDDFSIVPISIPEPFLLFEEKQQLLQSLIKILPKIGKDTSLALSVIRALVMLTRTHKLAKELGQKQNIRSLFLMVRQLNGLSNSRLQNGFMLILRHIVEDDEIIRNIMRSEIQQMFDSRAQRPSEVSTYVRQTYHLALRSPEIYVEVTNEKLQFSRWDARSQSLTLKKDETPQSDEGSSSDDPKPSTEVVKPDATPAKPQEIKPPVVGNPDGVIHYLLCELLAYKDVKDSEQKEKPESEERPAAAGDTAPNPQLLAVEAAASDDAASVASADAAAPARSDQKFKPEEHTIYMYRCFLLQCLAELLSSYNRTKIEFINFSRKSDPLVSTPSKPRAGILNYLLNALVPTGSIAHPTDIEAKKSSSTSGWAVSVLVALCSETGENGLSRKMNEDSEPDSDLTFVRKFVLDHAIKAFKEAQTSSDVLEMKYSRLLGLSDLFHRMLVRPQSAAATPGVMPDVASPKQLAKMMYEKNLVAILTNATTEIDLNFPHAKRAIKYILKPLKYLLHLSIQLSQSSELPLTPGSMEDDAISSASSVSDMSHDREETPDLYRNSTLGVLEPNHDDEFDDGEDMDEDVELYDPYPEDMEYDEEPEDEDDVVSDEDDEDMGPIEGVPGDLPIDVEVVMDDGADLSSDEDDDDDDMDEDDDMDDEDDEDDDEDDESHSDLIDEDFIDDNDSLDDRNGWEDGDAEYGDFEDFQDEEGANLVHADGLDNIVSLLQGDQPPVQLLQQLDEDDDLDIDGRADNYLDEDDMDDMEGDEEDDEDDYDEDEDLIYRPDFDDDDSNLPPGAMWGTFPPAGIRFGHAHHHHHHDPMRLDHFRSHIRDPIRNIYGTAPHRSHRPGGDRGSEGTNPLLARPGPSSQGGGRGMPHPIAVDLLGDFPFDFDPLRIGRGAGGMAGEMPFALINQILSAVQQNTFLHGRPAGQIRFSITGGIPGQRLPTSLEGAFRISGPRGESNSQQASPFTAVYFVPGTTVVRWQEEAALLFGNSGPEKATYVINSILRLMVPPAMKAHRIEQEHKKKREAEEAERRAKEEAERKEREEREKKEKEEREAAEAAQREADERARAEEAAQHAAEHGDDDSGSDHEMEDTETGEAAAEEQVAAEDQPRITISLRGREFDITGMGIDPEFLEALPEDLREEAIMSHVAQQRAEQRQGEESTTSINHEFLEALPPSIRQEILEQEAAERRLQARDEERRRRAAEGSSARAEDMDASNFFATLDPQFRQVLLMEQDDATLAQLPAHIAEEARQLNGERRMDNQPYNDLPRLSRTRAAMQLPDDREEPHAKPKPRPYPQMLDKSGVAGLLRLMFVPMQGSARASLNEILRDICMNKQNRAEVISILLSILQDGSADFGAVERSFAQLSLRAKQSASGPKSPHPLKRTLTGQLPGANDLSPLTVVQQCLGTLAYLTSGSNSSMALFFLTEHETSGGLRHRTPKKGKGKEAKAIKYPLNALLSLLDRKIVMDSSQVMEQLASLLQIITNPLNHLLRKEKEAAQQEKPPEGEGAQPAAAAETESARAASNSDVVMTANDEAAPAAGQQLPETAGEQGAASASTPEEKKDDKEVEKEKRTKTFTPPEVPEHNLRLVVNIFATRECGPKAFRDTLALITNLSAIPGAKEVFGQELVRHAHALGVVILKDLGELLAKIQKAKSGTDLQGVALAKFSPATSDQAKLLRIFLALDYLFDPKRAETPDKPSNSTAAELDSQQREHILASIYDNSTFGPLWTKLSECLTAIRVRGDMFNVAAVLQPLIEVLMVVCKNTTLKDAPLTRQTSSKEFSVSSPQAEPSGMENLFFSFTEEHRKILNDLVRQNPKLMSGSFSLMVKNSKVLEFDNKRNYFNRELHRRSDSRHPHPTLQLQVRRDQVFLDSFKSLYFKSGDEMKYGKLNIRFHGEEGVDAGGVTREWFQVLSKQMFNPDYALFNPVASDRTTFHPNPHSMINPEHLMYFKFIGRIIGKALYEGRVLDCHFSRAVYKRMLGKAVNVKDMESLDLDYYKSLLWMLENDITDIITETFCVESDVFGETIVHDLKENGRNIPVTEANKHEYVRLVVENRLTGAVTEQLEHFLKGFHEIVPAELISIFNEQELELLISGLPDIDVDDWKNNSTYQNYTQTSPQIQWFWRAVRSFDKEERAKLLQFVTGTSKVPLNGFKELEGMNGFSKFTIHRDYGSIDRLPSSHTCFNQLDLPEYDSYETLRQQLYTAMTAGNEYFALA